MLFADLSGYTAVAERTDPEAVKSMLDSALQRLGEQVERFGGSIDKYIGDNVMAVFGAPVAHEDDPERAVRAALAMQAEMERINEQLPGDVAFLLRVGINTGEVLAGRMGEGYTVIGDTVNVAARLQAAARPGSVTVGETTYRASREVIAYDELEPLTLKGKAEPVAAWEARAVLAERLTQRAAPRTATPLIGRDDELRLLLSLTEQLEREGRPHLVTVIGQAGVGKSRLLRELTERAAEFDPAPAVEVGECPPFGSGISYWALAEVLRAQFGIAGDEPADSAWEKLRSSVRALLGEDSGNEEAERIAATIAVVLGLEAPEGSGAADAEDPQRMRETLFSSIRTLTERMCAQRPLLLAIEDIHWADEGMLDLIEHLARWVRGPLLILCLARDELLDRRPDWGGGRRNATSIALEPLSADETEEPGRLALPRQRRRLRAGHQGRPAGGRQPAVRGGDGQPAATSPTPTPRRSPTASTRCSPPGSTRCPPSSAACSSTPR